MKRYLENFENCLEREIPYCVAQCPFHMEIFNFIEKAGRGAATAAFKVYRNAVGFPRIANKLCTAPCRSVCPRNEHGGAVDLPLLEKASFELASNTSATDYNIPPKKERIAIIGAGLAGMAAVLRLSTKKYHIEVFERTDRIGGQLWELMDSSVFLPDIEQQLAHQQYEIHFNTEIKNAEELSQFVAQGKASCDGFDAVFVATGKGNDTFELLSAVSDMGDPYCKKLGSVAYFAGGELIEDEPIYALANGLHIGTVIDNYLKTGYMYYPSTRQTTRMCKDMADIENDVDAVQPADGNSYTNEEFMAEAARCIKCQCHACRQQCDLSEFTDKWPVRMRDEIVATTLEGKSELKATPARRLMSLCNQCGLCKEVCPEEIDLDGLFLAGRQKMHRQGKMPWPFHDFWLRDMAQANSTACALSGFPDASADGFSSGSLGSSCSSYAFFPGCQLGASEPGLVTAGYAALLSKQPDTGMLLQCCGIPLLWAGDTPGFEAYIQSLTEKWTAMGKPTLVLACMTCMKTFKEYLPDIPVISLYEIFKAWGIDICAEHAVPEGNFSIFNPCAARHETNTREAVAALVDSAGIRHIPLDENEEYSKCCGYGGHGEIANPDYTAFVARKRIAENEYPYITYCINCRDLFLKNGKPALHILNILAGTGIHDRVPTVTERQHNRLLLRKELAGKYLHIAEEDSMNKGSLCINVLVGDELKAKLDKELILEDEIAHTIDFCQRHDRKIYDEETGTYSGYCQIGYMTYWVEYKELEPGSFELVNAYAHRMQIELEAVWNGVKQETDLQ